MRNSRADQGAVGGRELGTVQLPGSLPDPAASAIGSCWAVTNGLAVYSATVRITSSRERAGSSSEVVLDSIEGPIVITGEADGGQITPIWVRPSPDKTAALEDRPPVVGDAPDSSKVLGGAVIPVPGGVQGALDSAR